MSYNYMYGDPIPQTDDEALKWLEGYPQVAHDLYKLYRGEGFQMDVLTALRKTLEACVPSNTIEQVP